MPTLNLTFTLDITEPSQSLLCEVLKCQPAGLEAELARFGPAAVSEYIDMFTGTGAISTATDVRERRLVALMVTRFKGASPSADQVARLFKMTPSTARALLRAVAGKHRLKIADELEKAIKAVLAAAHQPAPGAAYTVVVQNRLIVDLLNGELAAAPQPKTAIKASGDSINSFDIVVGSYQYLQGLHP